MGSNKNRWLLVEFIDTSTVDASAGKEPLSSRSLDGRLIYNALRDSVVSNFGDTGWGAVGMSLTGAYTLHNTSAFHLKWLQSSISRRPRTFVLFASHEITIELRGVRSRFSLGSTMSGSSRVLFMFQASLCLYGSLPFSQPPANTM